jgi:hypothetical protein
LNSESEERDEPSGSEILSSEHDSPDKELQCDGGDKDSNKNGEKQHSKGSMTRMDGDGASASGREGVESTAEQVRRRTFKGRSKPSEKCGTCKNCMNPHWKQKCVLLKGKKEGNMPASTSAGSKEAKSESENDVFVEELRRVLAEDGGIRGVEKVSQFLALTKRASEWGQRLAMLRVLQNSTKPVLETVVGSEGLLVLERWLNDAIVAKRIKFISESLTTLTRLPITLQSLKKPCEIGKAVGKLRKYEDLSEDVKSQARILVAKWKSLVGHKAPGPPSETAVKQEKSIPKADSQKAARPKLDDDDIFIPKTKPTSLSAQAQHSTKRVVTSNAAQLQGRDTKKTEVARVSASPLDSITMDSSPKFKKSQQIAPSEAPSTSKAATKSSGGPIVLFGPISARQRARMAADKIPDEPPRQKKQINKKITWPADESLVDVRWFLQKQAPVMAKKDAGSDEEEAIEAAEEEELPEHKNFVSAARKEHQSEAIALKEHREHESKEREVLMERLNLMRASVLWRDAPLLQATILTDNEVALGEDSTEKTRLAAVRHGIKPKMYLCLSEAPPNPEEPPQGSSIPPQPLELLTKIPLSVEEARQLRQNGKQSMFSNIGLAINHLKPSPASPSAHTSMITSKQAPPVPKPKPLQAIHRPMTKSAQPKFQPMLGLHGPAIKHPGQNPTAQRPMQSMSGTRTICMYYNTPRGCLHGDKCRYAHENPAQAATQPMKRARGPAPNTSAQPRKMVRQS